MRTARWKYSIWLFLFKAKNKKFIFIILDKFCLFLGAIIKPLNHGILIGLAIFLAFSDMEASLGPDFEKGLTNIK